MQYVLGHELIARCTTDTLRLWLGHSEHKAFQILQGRSKLDCTRMPNLHQTLVCVTLQLQQYPQIEQSCLVHFY